MSGRKKDRIPIKEKLAAALAHTMVEVDGKLVRAISYDDAKELSSEQILSLFQFDHGVHESIDGPTVHWNLTPRFIAEHRRKSNKIDIPQIAKTKRISAEQEAFRRRMLEKSGPALEPEVEKNKPSRKIQSRPFPKVKRPMRPPP